MAKLLMLFCCKIIKCALEYNKDIVVVAVYKFRKFIGGDRVDLLKKEVPNGAMPLIFTQMLTREGY